MRSLLLYITLWAFAVLAVVPLGQAQDIVDEAQRVHRIHRDALPQTTAYQLEVDARGWVWIATQSGIAYYNGRSWQKLESFNEAFSIAFDRGQRLLPTPDGLVWFAPRYGGVIRLDVRPGVPAEHWTWERTTTREGLPSDSVAALLSRRDGTLLAGTSSGVAAFTGSAWEPFAAPAPAASVLALLETHDGALWVAARQGIWVQQPDGAWQREHLPAPLTGRAVTALHEAADGRVWVTVRGGIAVRDADNWQVVAADTSTDELRNFTTILELENGTLWFGTYGPRHGVYILRPNGSWHRLGLDTGLPSDDVLSLARHPDGMYWIGTRNGVALFSGNEWATIDRTSGLASEYVWSITEDARGAYWFGTDHGVSVYDGTWRQMMNPDGEPFTDVRFIHHARDGRTFIASPTSLYVYREGRLQDVLPSPSLRFYKALEHGGEVHVTTTNGVYIYRDGTLVPFRPVQGMSSTIKAAFSARDGALWVGINRQGVMRLAADGSYDLYTTDHGLPGDDFLGLYEDDLGYVWAATTSGLGAFDGRRWRIFSDTTAVRLPDPFVYSVLQDAEHRYYVSTNRGVARMTRAPGTDTDVDALQFKVEFFGPSEGMPSYEANYGAALRDRQGRIWFGTVAGAALYDPADEFYVTRPAPLVIEQVAVDGLADSVLLAHRPAEASLRLAHHQRNVSFVYTLGAVSRPENIRYRTRLQGYDALSAWSAEGQRTFTNLPPGKYVFQVWGQASDGLVSGPVDFAFTIAAAPWASWWAYFFYSLGTLLVVAGIVRWRTGRLQRFHAREAAMLQERLSRKAAEAQAAHLRDENRRLAAEQFRDDMIRMLVHDLRSPLSIMQMVSREVATTLDMPRETISELTALVVGTSEQALRLVDLILDVSRLEAGGMPVASETVVVTDAVGEALSALWPLAEEKDIVLEADVTPGLPAVCADRRLLDRVLTNLLSNAIKFTPAGGIVRISALIQEERVELRVSDTGTGIPRSLRPRLFQKFAAGDEEGSGSGLGLAFCRLAVEAMGGRIVMAGTSEAGTTFAVTLPTAATTSEPVSGDGEALPADRQHDA